MSTELKTLKRYGNGKKLYITKFYGGIRRGVCVQLSTDLLCLKHDKMINAIQEEGFIQLSAYDIMKLIPIFARIILWEFKRRIKMKIKKR
jgi:hypothetical protein